MKRIIPRLAALAILLISAATLRAQSDVAFYAVFKNQIFGQDNPFAPALIEQENGDNPLSFGVFIATTGSNKVFSATVQTPAGATINVPANDGGDSSLNLTVGAENKLELDGGYGDGIYTVTINAVNDGTQTIALNISGDTYPSTPRISNLLAGRAIDGASNFTLTWDAFVGGTANDIIMVEVQQSSGNGGSDVFSSPSPGEPGQLTGLNSSVVIPAGSMAAGGEFDVTIRFIRPTAMTTQYASGLAGYMKETKSKLRTTGAGPADGAAPQLRDTKPSFGARDVADISVVSFGFNEPMDTVVNVANAVTWSGIATPANFVYSWSADGRVLYCHYSPSLPLNTTVGWTLNAAGSVAKLRDASGNNLPDNFMGEFTTATTSVAGQTDVLGLLLVKAQALYQTNSTPIAIGQFGVQLEADLRGINTVTNLSISGPAGGPIAEGGDHHGDSIEFEGNYALKTDLDAFFPSGSYTSTMTTVHDGTKTIVLDFPADNYPNDPTLQNLPSYLGVDSGSALSITWSAFAGGAATDLVALEILNDQGRTIFETPGPLEPGKLDGTATTTSIPAHTLAPGRQYECELIFAKVVDSDTTSYAGVTAAGAFVKVTNFELTTAGNPIVPSLSAIGLNNGQFQLRVHGEYRRIYTVQQTQNFTNWSDVISSNTDLVSTNGMGTADVTDQGTIANSRFYRAFEGFSQNQGQGGGSN